MTALGSAAIVLFLVEAVTGALLAVHFDPAPGHGFDSVRHIISDVQMGRMLRQLHHWGASMLAVTVALYVAQKLRGVAILLLGVVCAVTGYVLVISGGWPAYVAHAGLIPLAMAMLLARSVRGVRWSRSDGIVAFAAVAIAFALGVFVRIPLERSAIPDETADFARSEGYVAALVQLAHFLQGRAETMAIIVLPLLALLYLPLAQFVRGGESKHVRRKMFAGIGFAALCWGILTYAAIRADAPEYAVAQVDYSLPTGWMWAAPADLAAYGFFQQGNCVQCHKLEALHTGRSSEWMEQHFASKKEAAKLTRPKRIALARFLARLDPASADAFRAAPRFAIDGATLYEASRCGACHPANGAGGTIGPVLNGVTRRRTLAWIREKLADPGKSQPGSAMPSYPFNSADMRTMSEYLSILIDEPPIRAQH
jgi:cytochrome c551/c552